MKTIYKYPGPRPISKNNKGLIHKQQVIDETVPHCDIEEATCPQASRSCKPDGWPKGNPKYKNETRS